MKNNSSPLPNTTYQIPDTDIPTPSVAFFGTPEFSVIILDILKENNFIPKVIITREDKPQGRKMILTPPPVKLWAEKNNIPILQPKKIDDDFLTRLKSFDCDLFIVCAYGKILPESLLDIPKYKTLNVHPSLLPIYRGSSPIESAILNGDKETGVTIMELDKLLDHGPILSQKNVPLDDRDTGSTLTRKLAEIGGELLSECIIPWTTGALKAQAQNHEKATFTEKIKKEDGLIDIHANSEENYRKFRAYDEWPRTYFFIDKNDGSKIRVIIKDADLIDGIFTIKKVIPEGKKEMSYKDFIKNINL